MKLGPYALERETLPSVAANFVDAWRLRWRGVPALPGATAAEIATQVLKNNAHGVLFAGSGHFHYMWVSDFAKTLRGAEKVLSPGYLKGLIDYMVEESVRRGRVTSCFTPEHGFDMPYYRGDNLPWLVYAVDEFSRFSGDSEFAARHRPALQALLEDYERAWLADGLLDESMTGDWMDTICRPSSTYNNVCVLQMLRLAPRLGLRARTDAEAFERRLLAERFRGDHFVDYAGTDRLSVDAAAFTLYFGLFDAPLRDALIERLEASGLAEPYPIRCAPSPYPRELLPLITRLTSGYHSSIWLHLGLVYLNGLKRCGRDVSRRQAAVESLILRHHNVLEALDPDSGEPYRTAVFGCETGLSMAAGQYLELALG